MIYSNIIKLWTYQQGSRYGWVFTVFTIWTEGGVSWCPYDAWNVADALLRPDLLKREKIMHR